MVIAIAIVGGTRRNADISASETRAQTLSPVTTGSPASGAITVGRPSPGESRGSLEIDGRERTWRLYVPRSLPPTGEVPLVIGLHGGFGSGEQFAADAYFGAQAERGGFIAVYPDGISRGRLIEVRTWNAGNCCGEAADQNVDDVAFIEALIDRLHTALPLDADRVYITGHSNGAMMGYRLACELSDRIAAIAVVAGSLEAPCSPSEPVSILSIHGDADEHHPLEGGTGPRSVTPTRYNSVANSIASWVRFKRVPRIASRNDRGADSHRDVVRVCRRQRGLLDRDRRRLPRVARRSAGGLTAPGPQSRPRRVERGVGLSVDEDALTSRGRQMIDLKTIFLVGVGGEGLTPNRPKFPRRGRFRARPRLPQTSRVLGCLGSFASPTGGRPWVRTIAPEG